MRLASKIGCVDWMGLYGTVWILMMMAELEESGIVIHDMSYYFPCAEA